MAKLNGGEGSDTITGTAGSDIVNAKAGDDIVTSLEGNDTIFGGDGDDIIDGGTGNDVIWGGYLTSAPETDDWGANTILGGEGNDTIIASFDLSTYGPAISNEAQILEGGNGNDTLIGATTAGSFSGGAGNDTFWGIAPIMDGGDGDDAFNLKHRLSSFGSIDGGGGRDVVIFRTSNAGDLSRIKNTEVWTLIGMIWDQHPVLTVTDENISTRGFLTIDTQETEVWDFPVIDASSVADGFVVFRGGVSTDEFTGGKLGDVFDGGAGGDTLTGGAGDDTLDGGDGLDVAVYTGNRADYDIVEVTYNTFEVRDLHQGSDGTDTIIDVNKLRFADQDYVVVIAGLEIIGDNSGESFDGGDNADHIDGAGGDDTIDGNGGNDNLEGGTGGDVLNGDAGGDFIDGGAGGDTLNGGAGNDELTGGSGNDVYILGNSSDTVIELGGSARAAAQAAGGVDTIVSSISRKLLDFANVENISLTGATAANASGNAGANELRGNAGANVLSGFGGNDRLEGGLGADVLKGGAGQDTFVFRSGLGNGNVDVIADFSHVADTFQLDNSAFVRLALGKLSSLDFKLIANATSVKGVDESDRILYDKAHGDLYFDRDGSGTLYERVKFADVTNGTVIDHTDFFVV